MFPLNHLVLLTSFWEVIGFPTKAAWVKVKTLWLIMAKLVTVLEPYRIIVQLVIIIQRVHNTCINICFNVIILINVNDVNTYILIINNSIKLNYIGINIWSIINIILINILNYIMYMFLIIILKLHLPIIIIQKATTHKCNGFTIIRNMKKVIIIFFIS